MGKGKPNSKAISLVIKTTASLVVSLVALYFGAVREWLPVRVAVAIAPTYWTVRGGSWLPNRSEYAVFTAGSYRSGHPLFGRAIVLSTRDGSLVAQRYFRREPKIVGINQTMVWLRPDWRGEDTFGLGIPHLDEKVSLHAMLKKAGRADARRDIERVWLTADGRDLVATLRGGGQLAISTANGAVRPVKDATEQGRSACYQAHYEQHHESPLRQARTLCDGNLGTTLVTEAGQKVVAHRARAAGMLAVSALLSSGSALWTVDETGLVRQPAAEKNRHLTWAAHVDDRLLLAMQDGSRREPDLHDELHFALLELTTGRVVWKVTVD